MSIKPQLLITGLLGLAVITLIVFLAKTSTRTRIQAELLAPDFQFQFHTPESPVKNLSDLKGNVVLLNFWAHWCEPCIEEMPELIMLEQKFSGKPFILLAVHIDPLSPEQLSAVQNLPLPKNIVFKFWGDIAENYSVQTIPLSLLIDKQGYIREVFEGPRQWTDDPIVKMVESWL